MPDALDWSESYGFDDALRDTERFGPEAAAGPVHQLHNLFDREHKPIDLCIAGHERRRNFQHHEIVAATWHIIPWSRNSRMTTICPNIAGWIFANVSKANRFVNE